MYMAEIVRRSIVHNFVCTCSNNGTRKRFCDNDGGLLSVNSNWPNDMKPDEVTHVCIVIDISREK